MIHISKITFRWGFRTTHISSISICNRATYKQHTQPAYILQDFLCILLKIRIFSAACFPDTQGAISPVTKKRSGKFKSLRKLATNSLISSLYIFGREQSDSPWCRMIAFKVSYFIANRMKVPLYNNRLLHFFQDNRRAATCMGYKSCFRCHRFGKAIRKLTPYIFIFFMMVE